MAIGKTYLTLDARRLGCISKGGTQWMTTSNEPESGKKCEARCEVTFSEKLRESKKKKKTPHNKNPKNTPKSTSFEMAHSNTYFVFTTLKVKLPRCSAYFPTVCLSHNIRTSGRIWPPHYQAALTQTLSFVSTVSSWPISVLN